MNFFYLATQLSPFPFIHLSHGHGMEVKERWGRSFFSLCISTILHDNTCLAKTLFHLQFCTVSLQSILSTKIVILDKSPFIMWAVYNGNLIFMMNYFPRQIWPAWHEITFGWRERSLNGEHLYCPLPLLNIYSIFYLHTTTHFWNIGLVSCLCPYTFLLDIM